MEVFLLTRILWKEWPPCQSGNQSFLEYTVSVIPKSVYFKVHFVRLLPCSELHAANLLALVFVCVLVALSSWHLRGEEGQE